MDRFLARAESLGHAEPLAPGTEYTSFDMADLDVKVVLALAREDPRLAALVHVPAPRLCAYRGSPRVRFSPRRCRRCGEGGAPRIANIPGGVALTHAATARPRLHVPPELPRALERCRARFAVLNLGVYDGGFGDFGHANALLVDTRARAIERFEPAGASAEARAAAARLFARHFPGWAFVDANALPLQRADTDAFTGMCGTFGLLYVLYRLLNPDAAPEAVARHLADTPPARLRARVLRLNRFAGNLLRRFPAGALVRGRRRGPSPRASRHSSRPRFRPSRHSSRPRLRPSRHSSRPRLRASPQKEGAARRDARERGRDECREGRCEATSAVFH